MPNKPGVIVVGDVGIGKTRLAREALAMLGDRADHLEWIPATRAVASIPFGAVARLIPDDARADGDRLSVLRAIAAQVRRWGGRGRVVLCVDDAHHLDEGSAAALASLAIEGLAFVVVTLRREEKVSDAVTALWKDHGALRMELAPLSAEQSRALLEQLLNGQLDGLTQHLILNAAAGNPLALEELVRGSIASGTLRCHHGVWRVDGGFRPHHRITTLISERLRATDAEARSTLELLACGEPLPLRLAEQIVGTTAIAAAEASAMALIEYVDGDAQLRFTHPIYGEVIRAAMPVSRARALSYRLAETLLAEPIRLPDDVLRAATWQVAGGGVTHSEVVLAAARQSVERSDLVLAERLARAVCAVAPQPQAERLLAEVLQCRGRSAEAAATLSGDPPPSGAERAHWAVTRAEAVYWSAGDVSEAERILADATSSEGLTEGARSWILLFDGRCEQALVLSRTVLARPGVTDQALIWAAGAGTAAAAFLGRSAEARTIGERGERVAVAHAIDLPCGVQIGFGRCLSALVGGDLKSAQHCAAEGYRRAITAQASTNVGAWAGFRGLVELTSGHLGDAIRWLREAVVVAEDNDLFHLRRCWLGALAAATALSGAVDDAVVWLRRADDAADGTNRLFEPWLQTWRAYVSASCGAVTDAVETLSEVARGARRQRQPTVEAAALFDILRYSGATDHDRIIELTDRIDTDWSTALATAARGYATDDGELLRSAATRLTALDHDLLAAEAMTCATRSFRRAGCRAAAAACAEQATELRNRCDGARTPLAAPDDISALLTQREREIALLAIRYSGRVIAQRLGLSVHTVNNNLARAYAKLGVSGRAGLRDLLR